jgi:hypothetical protein
MLNVIMLSVANRPFMLSVANKPFVLSVTNKPFVLSVIMPRVIMLNVVAPKFILPENSSSNGTQINYSNSLGANHIKLFVIILFVISWGIAH